MTTRIPITKDNVAAGSTPGGGGGGLEERQKKIWEDMEADMDRRRREWEEEIDNMRKQFFLLRPHADALGLKDGGEVGAGGSESPSAGVPGEAAPDVVDSLGAGERMGLGSSKSRLLETTTTSGASAADDWQGMVVKDEEGNPVFRVVFDVREYRPEEVSVKMDAHTVAVSATHQADQAGTSVSRQYSREVRIPEQLDPLALQCLMGPDGMLTVEAPLPTATYSLLKEASTFPPIKPASLGSSAGTGTTPMQQSFSSSSSSSSYQTSYQPLPNDPAPSTFPHPGNSEPGLPPSEPVLPPYQPPQPDPAFSSYPRPDPALSSGFKPLSATVSNCQPVMADMGPGFVSSSAASQQTQKTSSAFPSSQTYHDSSSPELAGFSSPPFHSLSDPSAGPNHGAALNGVAGSGGMSSPEVSPDLTKFKLEVDIEDYRPEELTVKTQDRRVVVCARREEKVGNRSSSREMSREHTLPESVDPLTIKAFFTDGGKLIIEAPFTDPGLLAQMSGR